MGYIQDFEKEFRAILAEGDMEKTVKFTKEKILESYRNGQSEKKVVSDKEPEQK